MDMYWLRAITEHLVIFLIVTLLAVFLVALCDVLSLCMMLLMPWLKPHGWAFLCGVALIMVLTDHASNALTSSYR